MMKDIRITQLRRNRDASQMSRAGTVWDPIPLVYYRDHKIQVKNFEIPICISYILAPITCEQNRMEEDGINFIVRFCYDVIFEVFSFGERYQLTELERVGKRFHRIIEGFFGETPFICLNLTLTSRFFIK